MAGKSKASLSDLSRGGTKYVVLWFFPEDSGALNLEAANNAKEAQGFERLRAAPPEKPVGGVGGGALGFDDLDAVIVGVSALSTAELRSKLVDPYLLTLPFLADTRKELAEAFGAKNPLGDTFRQTFVIDPKGTILFIERNIQMGVGSEPLSPALACASWPCSRLVHLRAILTPTIPAGLRMLS